jgi:integrase
MGSKVRFAHNLHTHLHMASIFKHKDGYRAQVCVMGKRDTKVFRTKREASAWAAIREIELRESAKSSEADKHTLRELLEKYRDEETPKKRGRRWEEVRIDKLLRDEVLLPSLKLSAVTSDLIGTWRNKRLTEVAPGSVLREIGLLSSIFEHARRELKWITENPVKDVRKPASPDHRRILISRAQVRKMLSVMAYHRQPCKNATQAVCVAFLVALRTGMRAGELCGLTWDRVFDHHCSTSGKTAAARRDVPLTPKAKRLIESMRGYDPELVFGITANSLDAMFRKYRKRAGLEGFTFHDTRHTAATWLARKLHILDLCLMFGWSNTKHALIYYNAPAADIARQLSQPKRGQSR